MSQRCPSSTYVGVGRLQKYRRIINSRGYANVVPSSNSSDEVYGLVYSLTPSDEARLDVNEGVPDAYEKEIMEAELWSSKKGQQEHNGNDAAGWKKAKKTKLLVYIDRHRTTDDEPKKEYIYRMNMGIEDALKCGIPKAYIEKVLRPFIPEGTDPGAQQLAKKQATKFEEEV